MTRARSRSSVGVFDHEVDGSARCAGAFFNVQFTTRIGYDVNT